MSQGFESCYRSLYRPISEENGCEKSFDAPFLRARALPTTNTTRVESFVDYGKAPFDWSLPFMNDYPRLRYLWLDRFPFTASFAARVDGSGTGRVLPVFGIGEVSVSVNGLEAIRIEDYSREFVAAVPLPAESSDLVVSYEYRDDEELEPDGAPEPRGPYARLKIGAPMTIGELAEVSRVRITGEKLGADGPWEAKTVVLDRDGNAVTVSDVNMQRVSIGEELDPLLRPSDLEVEIPATALLRGPLTLKSIREDEPTVLGTISALPGTLTPLLSLRRAAVEFGTFSVALTAVREELSPLRPGVRNTPTFPLRALLAVLDLATVAILAALAYVLMRTMRTDIVHAIAFALLGWLAIEPLDAILPTIVGGGRELVIPYAIIAAIAVLAYRHQIDRYPLPFLLPLTTLLGSEKILEHLSNNHPGHGDNWWGRLIYYWRDSDWLANAGNARAVLLESSLRAGEDVFWFRAGPRYLLAAGQFLLGENALLIGIVSLALGFVVILALASRFVNAHPYPAGYLIGAFTAFIGLIFLGDQIIVAFAFFVSSEYPTWIALLGTTTYLLNSQHEPRTWKIVGQAAMLAALVHFRPNNVLVSVVFFVLLVLLKTDRTNSHVRLQQTISATVAFICVISLSLLHNLYYGGQFVVFSPNPNLMYALQLGESFRAGGLSTVIADLWSQFSAVMYWRAPHDANFAIFFWGSQATLGIALILRARQHRLREPATTFSLVPLTYAGPMLLFTLDSYYPRLIVTASLLCLTSALLCWSSGESRRP